MIKGLFNGFGHVVTGLSLITRKGIRPFVLLPLLVNIILFSLGIWLAESQFEYWMNRLLPSWLSWLEWLLWPLFAILIVFVIFYAFSMLANLIAAPFNSLLAERVEASLYGRPIPGFEGWKSIPGLIVRTFRSELAKLWYMGKWFLLLLILTLVPGVNIIAPLLWTLFGAWMLAIEYVDYPMGNHNLFFREELATLKQTRTEAFGFGGALALLTAIPVVNFFVMPIGVAGATAMWVKRLSNVS